MHADRDRSEPFWPPAAAAAYAAADEPVPFLLTDEPVGAPAPGLTVSGRWLLDEGDPGTPLLPAAPAGVELACTVCPVTLADTRGGRLEHHDDGTHTLVPSQPAAARATPAQVDEERQTRYAEAIMSCYSADEQKHLAHYLNDEARAVVAVADAEQSELRERIEFVEQEWEHDKDGRAEWFDRAQTAEAQVRRILAVVDDMAGYRDLDRAARWVERLRAALAGPEPEATAGGDDRG